MLGSDNMLACYDPSEGLQWMEFQVGGTLVWVQRPMSMLRCSAVYRANRILRRSLSDITKAFDLVATVAMDVQPADLVSRSLTLMSIAIFPSDGSSRYDLQADLESVGDVDSTRGIDIMRDLIVRITALPRSMSEDREFEIHRAPDGSLRLG